MIRVAPVTDMTDGMPSLREIASFHDRSRSAPDQDNRLTTVAAVAGHDRHPIMASWPSLLDLAWGVESNERLDIMREAKTMNPVILLDEIDKLADGWSGDPASGATRSSRTAQKSHLP